MNIEYGLLAKYYDIFYKDKNYIKETEFLLNIIKDRKNILDAGCGTGTHMQILEKNNYMVDGFDISNDMIDIAKTKVVGDLYIGDILSYKSNKKYDAIISMFAVFNHLKDICELEIGINNLYNLLNIYGVLIIDLHNGRTSSIKTDEKCNIKRIMEWKYNSIDMTEHTNIKYIINGKEYNTCHDFKIFSIDDIKEVLDKNNYRYNLYENYSDLLASDNSKNIQIVIYK